MKIMALDMEEREEVYPPSEDTYLMIRAISVSSGDRVLEIGPGSGMISIHCALNGCDVTAVDINPLAVELTGRNADRYGAGDRVKALQGDLFDPVGPEKFDVIIFNPPYLVSEEAGREGIDAAWDGGRKGREITERFLRRAHLHIQHGGRIYLLIERKNGVGYLKERFPEYRWEKVAHADFFFEHLEVYMLRT